MNIIDVALILFSISALIRGMELGLVRQAGSTLGLVGGLLLGAWVQSRLLGLAQTPGSKALLALSVIMLAIALFTVLGEYAGAMLKLKLLGTKRKLFNTADRIGGSIMAGVTVLLMVWMAASIFAGTPSLWLQRQFKGSVIIASLNGALPPAPDVVARLGHLIDPNGFPDVFTGLEPRIDTNQPLPSIGELDPAVQHARASVVKVEGEGCGGFSQGSGFVADRSLVITNAHVVAGVMRPYVIDASGRHNVQVLGFDPDLDIAVLKANDLAGAPLRIDNTHAANGTAAATVGYPGGGAFTASPAVILESFRARGRNIYNQGETLREIYSLRGEVHPGSSGGPLIDKDGDVIGVIFAESTSYQGIGYALTTDKVIEDLNLAKDRGQTVGTGTCAS
jgi:S1-C subfamily serine protease